MNAALQCTYMHDMVVPKLVSRTLEVPAITKLNSIPMHAKERAILDPAKAHAQELRPCRWGLHTDTPVSLPGNTNLPTSSDRPGGIPR